MINHIATCYLTKTDAQYKPHQLQLKPCCSEHNKVKKIISKGFSLSSSAHKMKCSTNIFLPKNSEELCIAKAPHFFLQKNGSVLK